MASKKIAATADTLNSIVEFGNELGTVRYSQNRDGSLDAMIRIPIEKRGVSIRDVTFTIGDVLRPLKLTGYFVRIGYGWEFDNSGEAKLFYSSNGISKSDRVTSAPKAVSANSSFFRGSAKEHLWPTARQIDENLRRKRIKKPNYVTVHIVKTADGKRPK